MPFALKLNFNGGKFQREISKIGYFKKLEKIRINQKKLHDSFRFDGFIMNVKKLHETGKT